jgi:pimeloyl-ACP methyl ester carboxylesterase
MVTILSKDGTQIASWRSGTGSPLVLVHGGTTDHTAWKAVLPELERHFTVYAIDRRGRGGSADAPSYSVEREFQDVAAVVDSLEGSVHLVGHSYGALCALEAARLTSNIAKLVLYEPPLINGSAGIPPGFIDELDDLLAQGKRDELTARFLHVVLGRSPEFIDELRADPSWASRLAAAHTLPRELRIVEVYRFQPERFADMCTPTLLLEGEISPPFLKASVAAARAGLPQSQLVVLQGQGHAAMLMAPELFTSEVLNFLRDAPS